MKKTDIAMIILIASISVIVAYFVVGAIPGLKDATKPVSVKTIDEYDADMGDLNKDVFNDQAINPTVEVTIGQSN